MMYPCECRRIDIFEMLLWVCIHTYVPVYTHDVSAKDLEK